MSFSLRKILKSKLFFAVGLAILVLLIIAFGREFSRRYALEQQVKSLESQVAEIENKNQEFTQLIDYFNTQNFTEEEARLKMGLKKPGEEVVVINQPAVKTRPAEAPDNLANLSNPAKWWYYFFASIEG